MMKLYVFFVARIWWDRRNCNSACLSQEAIHMYIFFLGCLFYSMEDSFCFCFNKPQVVHTENCSIKWISLNLSYTIINVDGSCNGTPTHIGFDGTFRTSYGIWQCDFSNFISNSSYILHLEHWSIHKASSLAKGMWVTILAYYIDSSPNINLIETTLNKYHKQAMLIHSIKDLLLENTIFKVIHMLREWNQREYYITKLGTYNNEDLLIHTSHLPRLSYTLAPDVAWAFF